MNEFATFLLEQLAKECKAHDLGLSVAITDKPTQESVVQTFNMEGVHKATVAQAFTAHVTQTSN